MIGGDGSGSVNSRLNQARQELEELISQVSDALTYDGAKTYQAGEIVRQGNRLYQARTVVSGKAPPDPVYWLDIGTVTQTAEGLATQVTQNATSIEQQGDTLIVHGEQLNAVSSKVDDPATGLSATASGLQKMTTEVTRIGDELQSTSQHVDSVEASVGDAMAAVQQVSKALASTDGKLEAMWAVKMELTQDGQYVAAGFGLGIENTEAGLQSQFLVSADRFAMVNTLAGGERVTPFLVQNGQMFINQAFIQDGSITNLKVGAAAIESARIQSAAISSAHIQDLAVNSGHIQDLAVDTLKIAGRAVTVPISYYAEPIMSIASWGTTINWQTISTLNYTGSGEPALLNSTFQFAQNGSYSHWRPLLNGNVIAIGLMSGPSTTLGNPQTLNTHAVSALISIAGPINVQMQCAPRPLGSTYTLWVGNRGMTILEVKR